MAMVTRSEALATQNYVDQVVKGKDYSIPSLEACQGMSKLLDASAHKAYSFLEGRLEEATPFKRAVKTLREAPAACGGFIQPNHIILNGLTPFEQMAAICYRVKEDSSTIKQSQPLALAPFQEGDRIVPVWVRKPRGGGAPSPGTVLLGHYVGRAEIRGPLYTRNKPKDPPGWDEKDPKEGPERIFIEPLNALEMHRHSQGIGALLLKANPYERGSLTNKWRYKVFEQKPVWAREASVELSTKKKNRVTMAALAVIKAQSAGYNLAKMVETRTLKNQNLLRDCYFEEYRDEGYDCEAEAFTSPLSIVQRLPEALKGNTDPLDEEMAKLFATQLQFSSIPVVKTFAANALFPE